MTSKSSGPGRAAPPQGVEPVAEKQDAPRSLDEIDERALAQLYAEFAEEDRALAGGRAIDDTALLAGPRGAAARLTTLADDVEHPKRRKRSPGKRTSADDPLWNIIGIGAAEGPTDIAENKRRYLTETYDTPVRSDGTA